MCRWRNLWLTLRSLSLALDWELWDPVLTCRTRFVRRSVSGACIVTFKVDCLLALRRPTLCRYFSRFLQSPICSGLDYKRKKRTSIWICFVQSLLVKSGKVVFNFLVFSKLWNLECRGYRAAPSRWEGPKIKTRSLGPFSGPRAQGPTLRAPCFGPLASGPSLWAPPLRAPCFESLHFRPCERGLYLTSSKMPRGYITAALEK